MRIVLLGPPGAGKGTLAGFFKETQDFWHISTGDILREEMKNDTEVGRKIKGLVDKGELVPDDIVTEIIEMTIRRNHPIKKGFMLDGFPRTRIQARALDKILAELKLPLDFALYMKASLSIIVERLAGRWVCRQCGALFHVHYRPPQRAGICDQCDGPLYQRSDDNEQTLQTRMEVYLKNTAPVFDYYKAQGKLLTVNADKDVEGVYQDLLEIIHESQRSDQNQRSGGVKNSS